MPPNADSAVMLADAPGGDTPLARDTSETSGTGKSSGCSCTLGNRARGDVAAALAPFALLALSYLRRRRASGASSATA